MENQKGQSSFINTEGSKTAKKRGKKLLSKNGDQILEAKLALDALLEQGTGLPGEIKKAIAAARDTAWEAFKNRQEAQMKLYS